MQKEYHIIKKRKNKIPSKKVLNLYYKEDTTTRPSTIALYVLFILVVCLAAGKIGIYDKMIQIEEAKAALEEQQAYLEEQMAYLADYKTVSSEYSRYSFSYLTEEEKLTDRVDILDILEETVFAMAKTDTLVISDNIVSLNFEGLTLEEASWLAKKIEDYEPVESVVVNTASLNYREENEEDGLMTRMVITLVKEETEENQENQEVGGEQ